MRTKIHLLGQINNIRMLSLLEGATIMKFERLVGGSFDGTETHKSKYYQYGFNLASRAYLPFKTIREDGLQIADPFARNCPWGTHTNDIDPNTNAQSNMDALEWLKEQPTQYFDVVLFDPPFSAIQAKKYEAGHINVYTDPSYVSNCWKEISRILAPSGRVLKLGYNSTRHVKTLDLVKGYIVNFGGSRNDVIMTIWEKRQMTLEEYFEPYN